jgi:hypothetical protein
MQQNAQAHVNLKTRVALPVMYYITVV